MANFDIYNVNKGDFFVKTRTVFLYGQIDAATAYDVGCRLKYLDYIDSTRPITLEINSPGGEVSSGLAIVDTMNCIESPVKIVVCGMATERQPQFPGRNYCSRSLLTARSRIWIPATRPIRHS